MGILASISAPSFLSFVTRARAKQDYAEFQGLLQRTQREAIQRSQTCRVTLPTNNTQGATITSDCQLIDEVTLENVTIKYNNTGSQVINFDYRGNTSPLRTILLYNDQTSYQECLVISNGIGIIRRGIYTGDPAQNVSASFCETTG